MDYSYNYGYLQQFMDSHKLAKKDLLEALGCGDYVSLNKWLDGKVPGHVTAMLRFCNYYNIPLADSSLTVTVCRQRYALPYPTATVRRYPLTATASRRDAAGASWKRGLLSGRSVHRHRPPSLPRDWPGRVSNSTGATKH